MSHAAGLRHLRSVLAKAVGRWCGPEEDTWWGPSYASVTFRPVVWGIVTSFLNRIGFVWDVAPCRLVNGDAF